MNRKNMRLLVLGDENVGKSSLIHTIYSEVSSNVEKTLKKVILPPEMCLYSKEVFTELIDTSVEMDITADIRSSDLVLLVYDVSDPETITGIETDWLPRINNINPKIPVILVGNKIDKKQLQFQNETEYIKVKDILKKVIRRFKNVQMGIECSAFYDRNVKSVLNCAQRAVLYPLSPLYNLEEKKITKDFRKALTRIFRILDQDFDGRIHDSQMNSLQQRVFQSELNLQDIKAIKEIILRQLEVQQHEYIQLDGFIALQKKVIEMLKIQICWSIVRHFNYDDNLRIRINTDHFSIQQAEGESVELSSQVINFLLKIYHLSRKNFILKQSQQRMIEGVNKRVLQTIFQSCPQIQFPQFSGLNDMNEQKFLTTWNLYSFLDYKKCYEDLLYLGYQKSIQEAFYRRKSKKSYNDFQKIKDNRVFTVLLINNQKYKSYIDPLFGQGTQIRVNQQKGEFYTYSRTSLLFNNQNISKTFLLFKINKEHLKQFYKNDPKSETYFSRRIDLVIEFEGNNSYENSINVQQIIPNFILYRNIQHTEGVNVLNINNPPKLDLSCFPIRYELKLYSAFFNEIIYKVIQNIDQGLKKQKIIELKEQKQHKKNVMLLSAVSIVITAAVLGSYVFKRLRLEKQ